MEPSNDWVGLMKMVVQIEETKESIYRDVAEGAKEASIKQLLEVLAEAKKRHVKIFSSMLDREEEWGSAFETSTGMDGVMKKASWILRNLERKKEIAPTIKSRMLIIEFLQRTEEESLEFHKSLRENVTGVAGQNLDMVLAEEKKDVENLTHLAFRTLTYFYLTQPFCLEDLSDFFPKQLHYS